MGLREMLKEQAPSEEPKSNSNELKSLIEEQAQTIETQLSTISTLQSEMQKMQSALTMANETIDLLKSRASSVNKAEIKLKKALEESQKALKSSFEDKQRAKQAQKNAEYSQRQAEQALAQAKKDSEERYKAQEQARTIERVTKRSKLTYKSLFIGNSIFTLILAFFVAYSKREVITEMLQWFPSRWNNIKAFASWIAMSYMAAIHLIEKAWKLKPIWNYLIVSVLALGLAVGLIFVLRLVIGKVKDFMLSVKLKYDDEIFKGIVSGDIALGMLYICLFFADPIKTIIPFNILSVWLILSFIGITLWHIPEVKRVIEK